MNLKQWIRLHYRNSIGWTTDKKIIVIESDDWGATRTPSLDVLKHLKKHGLNYPQDSMDSLDSIASSKDLDELFNVLSNIQSKNKPVFTTNFVVANANFNKIKESEYSEYHYEPFTKTLRNYYGEKVIKTWEDGIKNNFVYPQLHSREHFNVNLLLETLRSGDQIQRLGFDLGISGVATYSNHHKRFYNEYQIVFNDPKHFQFHKNSLIEAQIIFEKTFGYKSNTFIAPVYTWYKSIEEVLKEIGVKSMQSGIIQNDPEAGRIRHYQGEPSKINGFYTTRNVVFEPASDLNIDWISKCLAEVKNAFFHNKPAIISTHRFNYISSLNSKIAERSLRLLSNLLQSIVNKWPEVVFLSSDEMSQMILNDSNT